MQGCQDILQCMIKSSFYTTELFLWNSMSVGSSGCSLPNCFLFFTYMQYYCKCCYCGQYSLPFWRYFMDNFYGRLSWIIVCTALIFSVVFKISVFCTIEDFFLKLSLKAGKLCFIDENFVYFSECNQQLFNWNPATQRQHHEVSSLNHFFLFHLFSS